jgi:hypothetical protein
VQRLAQVSPALFQQFLSDLLPLVYERWQKRQRPIDPLFEWSQRHYRGVLAANATSLDVLCKRLGIAEPATGVLPGRLASLIRIDSQFPLSVWYELMHRPYTRQEFWERILSVLPTQVLLVCDIDPRDEAAFHLLSERKVGIISRVRHTEGHRVVKVLQKTPYLQDSLVQWNTAQAAGRIPLRLVAQRTQEGWYQYVSNVTNPAHLPADAVAALHQRHVYASDVFQLLGTLLPNSALLQFDERQPNAEAMLQIQFWSAWLLHAMLLDISDALAEVLQQPAGSLPIRNIYRGLHDFYHTQRLDNTDDPIIYLAAKARDLDLFHPDERRSAVTDWHDHQNAPPI